MELTDICPMETWEALENNLYTKFNFQGSVFNPRGIRISQVKNWSNDLCPAIKATKNGQSYICSTAHMNMSAMAEKTKGLVMEECDAGFIKLVVPIIYDGEFLGVAGGCGLLAEDGDADIFAINKIAGIEETTAEELAQELPVITREELAAAGAYLQEQVLRILDAHAKKESHPG
ncbi:MAG: PocR ligand-binding domain-containing protein [Proteobacteria bacterium]|nr:PocR ligand-binding domain-containing protein [Pseudomonadota bacterium]